MNTHLNNVFLILMLGFMVSLSSGCTSPQSESPATASLSTGVVTTTEVIAEQETPLQQPTVPVPENYELKTPEILGPVIQDMLNDPLIFVGQGRLTNAGQTLEITVNGTSEASVIEYLETTRIYFEIRDPIENSIVREDASQPTHFAIEDLLKDEKIESLNIFFNLPSEIKRDKPQGSLLVIVDPLVKEDQAHIYSSRDPNNDRADVTITSSQGGVVVTLYLGGKAINGQTKKALINLPQTVSGEGEGNFDLSVSGLNTGDNIYQLIGSWNYDYRDQIAAAISTITLKPGTGFIFTSQEITSGENAGRDVWWNGLGLVPNRRMYSLGLISSPRDFISFDSEPLIFKEFIPVGGEGFVVEVNRMGSDDYAIIRIISVLPGVSSEITFEWEYPFFVVHPEDYR